MKALKAKLPEDQQADFEKKAGAYAKKIVANFKDYEFYIGESMDPDGMVALLNYREDGVTRTFCFQRPSIIALITPHSLLHLLEARCQGGQVLNSLSFYVSLVYPYHTHRATVNGQNVTTSFSPAILRVFASHRHPF